MPESGEKRYLQVSDVMTKRPVVSKPTTTIDKIAAKLARHKISSILILEGKKPVGIITSDDIVYRVVSQGKDPKSIRASEIMTSELVLIGPGAGIQEAVQLLNDEKIRQLPVVDGNTLVGYVTVKDIIRIEPELIHMITEDLKQRQEERRAWVQKYVDKEYLDEDLFE